MTNSNPLSRRRFLSNSLATAATLSLAPRLFAVVPATCTLTPEQEIGPFYVGGELVRSSLGEGRPGLPLHLTIRFVDSRTCTPLRNAAIDLWHCDASGLYSGYTKTSMEMPGGDGPGDHHGPPPGGFGPPPGGVWAARAS